MEEATFKKWFLIKCRDNEQFEFELYLNTCIVTNKLPKTYYKVFWSKKQSERMGIFYLATEQEEIVGLLKKKYNIMECPKPERKLISRYAGFSADREWMK